MIILTLGGGLGNQMFEYAFARMVQNVAGDEIIKLSLYHVTEYEDNKESLHNLCISSDVKLCNSIEEKYYKLYEKIKRNILLQCCKNKDEGEKFHYFSRRGIFFLASTTSFYNWCKPVTRWKFIYGVYQNPAYWKGISNDIKKELKVKTAISSENQNMLKLINAEEAVCVHIRRGDYITNPQWDFLNICSSQYYLEAMDYMLKVLNKPVFFFFFNNHTDIEWIRNNFKLERFNPIYVDLNNPDYEELRLMYNCKHFIIANSTFSWWAQFLSENKSKKVCAPSIWSKNFDGSNFYEPDWKIINVE